MLSAKLITTTLAVLALGCQPTIEVDIDGDGLCFGTGSTLECEEVNIPAGQPLQVTVDLGLKDPGFVDVTTCKVDRTERGYRVQPHVSAVLNPGLHPLVGTPWEVRCELPPLAPGIYEIVQGEMRVELVVPSRRIQRCTTPYGSNRCCRSTSECLPGSVCEAHRCSPIACTDSSVCPENYLCADDVCKSCDCRSPACQAPTFRKLRQQSSRCSNPPLPPPKVRSFHELHWWRHRETLQ